MIARLTAWQCEAVPAAQARRVERPSRDRPAAPGAPTPLPPPPADAPPPRAALVADYMQMGMSRDAAEAQYDRQLAAWRAARGNPV